MASKSSNQKSMEGKIVVTSMEFTEVCSSSCSQAVQELWNIILKEGQGNHPNIDRSGRWTYVSVDYTFENGHEVYRIKNSNTGTVDTGQQSSSNIRRIDTPRNNEDVCTEPIPNISKPDDVIMNNSDSSETDDAIEDGGCLTFVRRAKKQVGSAKQGLQSSTKTISVNEGVGHDPHKQGSSDGKNSHETAETEIRVTQTVRPYDLEIVPTLKPQRSQTLNFRENKRGLHHVTKADKEAQKKRENYRCYYCRQNFPNQSSIEKHQGTKKHKKMVINSKNKKYEAKNIDDCNNVNA